MKNRGWTRKQRVEDECVCVGSRVYFNQACRRSLTFLTEGGGGVARWQVDGRHMWFGTGFLACVTLFSRHKYTDNKFNY